MEVFQQWFDTLLSDAGVAPDWISFFSMLIGLAILIAVAVFTYLVIKHFLIRFLNAFFRKTSFKWDDVLADRNTFNNLAHIIPAIIVRIAIPKLFVDYPQVQPFMIKVGDVYILIAATLIIISFVKAVEYILSQSPVFANKPLASYFQLLRIVIYIAIFITILSVLLGKSPMYFLTAFGAMTAIILLIFKDTILGLVASVQISANDVVRVGDWVEMPKYNADGDVIAINLNTVKVRNWDKTITAIPTFYFITDSFKNWRGMQESGGRRIKRSILFNVHTVKFVNPETRERFKQYSLITEYVSERQNEIEVYNTENGVDTSQLINGRRMTNIGVFRIYVENYLKQHKGIQQEMTMLVRQLPSDDRGLPIEIYCFTNTTSWLEYETIQSDIFDHLFAAASWFELELYQQPAGSDIALAIEKVSQISKSQME
ncbi:mechanosensitive ion channel family protein [Flavobacterium ardleyense]|uniref:mechanosensitive ion channel family protein n=1 Tax=Flavobacterium ardleyense TaxID=2038737 RepID=UPI00298C206E|nr:mechanosensitive ion channel domain-containing protein [Flavobacterium ardleyense]